jgi:hypothetical protein
MMRKRTKTKMKMKMKMKQTTTRRAKLREGSACDAVGSRRRRDT